LKSFAFVVLKERKSFKILLLLFGKVFLFILVELLFFYHFVIGISVVVSIVMIY